MMCNEEYVLKGRCHFAQITNTTVKEEIGLIILSLLKKLLFSIKITISLNFIRIFGEREI